MATVTTNRRGFRFPMLHNMYCANTHVFTEEVMTLVSGASSPLVWFCVFNRALKRVRCFGPDGIVAD